MKANTEQALGSSVAELFSTLGYEDVKQEVLHIYHNDIS